MTDPSQNSFGKLCQQLKEETSGRQLAEVTRREAQSKAVSLGTVRLPLTVLPLCFNPAFVDRQFSGLSLFTFFFVNILPLWHGCSPVCQSIYQSSALHAIIIFHHQRLSLSLSLFLSFSFLSSHHHHHWFGVTWHYHC